MSLFATSIEIMDLEKMAINITKRKQSQNNL